MRHRKAKPTHRVDILVDALQRVAFRDPALVASASLFAALFQDAISVLPDATESEVAAAADICFSDQPSTARLH